MQEKTNHNIFEFHGIIFILYLLEETIQQRSFVESLL